jgi:hypothetical protein
MGKYDIADTKFKSLRCFDRAITLRQTGATNADVARFIESEGDAWWPAGSRTGEQAVRRFFLRNPELAVTKDPVLAQSIEKKWDGSPPTYITKLRDQVESSLDALVEMECLYTMQKRRIEVLFDKEEEGERVGTALRAEMTLGMRMLNDVARLQMDTGVLTKEPTKIDARIAQYSKLDVGRELLTVLTHPELRKVLRDGEMLEDYPELQGLLESPEGVKERIRRGLIED